MAFTYNLSSTDATALAISKVRFEIGDTVQNTGVKPSGANFSDEEVTHLLTEEGSDVYQAAGHACEILARSWALMANETRGPRKTEYATISGNFEKLGASLRAQSPSTYRIVTFRRSVDDHDTRR
jgi:hypothetical protein